VKTYHVLTGRVNVGLEKLSVLERSNLSAEIADRLRELISSGDIPPGTRLIEAEVASQLGVSRGSVREAFRILETEGLLESFPGRGSFVAKISERDIREVYSLRCILEEEAMRLAAENGTNENFDRLQETMESMINAAKDDQLTKVTDLDFQFHHQIWEIAGHNRLKEVLEGITTQIRMYLAVQTQLYDDLAAGISDHQLLLQALRKRDGEGAAQAMRNHLEVASEVVLDYFIKNRSTLQN
jgi:DNA-binding GntR family transcriptional regulator